MSSLSGYLVANPRVSGKHADFPGANPETDDDGRE